jgi:hypothetical protein
MVAVNGSRCTWPRLRWLALSKRLGTGTVPSVSLRGLGTGASQTSYRRGSPLGLPFFVALRRRTSIYSHHGTPSPYIQDNRWMS